MAIATRPKSEPKPSPSSTDTPQTLADLLARLGGVPASRVRYQPPVGTATEADLLAANDRPDRAAICELVDGVLVEKPVGMDESEIAVLISHFLLNYVRARKLGRVYGADGHFRLGTDMVRVPDVSFLTAGRAKLRKRGQAIYDGAPDFAVEVLSPSNRKAEIRLKIDHCFRAGTRLFWVVDPKKRTVTVYKSPTDTVVRKASEALDGGDLFPGLVVPVSEIFEGLD